MHRFKRLHPKLPAQPTWSTSIYLDSPSIEPLKQKDTTRLAALAAIDVDQEVDRYTMDINAFASLIDPILNVETNGIEPFISPVQDHVILQADFTKPTAFEPTRLIHLAEKKEDGYYVVERL